MFVLFVLFHLAIVLSVLLFTACDYPFSIFTHLAIVLSVLLLTACDYPFSIFTHLAIVLSVLRFTACDYPFSIFTHLAIVLSVLLFTACDYPFSIFTHLAIVLSVLRFTACDYPFDIVKHFIDLNKKNIDIKFSVHDTFLESPSSGTIIIKRMESQITKKPLQVSKSLLLSRLFNVRFMHAITLIFIL